MRVAVTVTILVDRDAYDAEYGEHATAEAIREHVKAEATSAIESAFSNIDAVTVEGWR